MEHMGQVGLDLVVEGSGSGSVFGTEESHHEDAYSSVSERKCSNGFSSVEESISDQLERDVLVGGPAIDGLDEFQHDCLIAEEKSSGVEGVSGAGEAFLRDG